MKKLIKALFILIAYSNVYAQGLNLEWASGISTNSTSNRSTITATCTDYLGNIYVTGFFQGTIDLDPNLPNYLLTSTSLSEPDLFIQKLDRNGNLIWAKKIGGNSDEEALAIAVDSFGGVYVTGRYESTVDFDPGPGVFNLVGSNLFQFFTLKLDAAGDFLWANGHYGYNSKGTSISLDKSGNVYVTGEFQGTVDFDPNPTDTFNLISSGQGDIFVQKMDPNGNLIWAYSVGGASGEGANSIYADDNGAVYLTGYFGGTVDFDPGPGIVTYTPAGGWRTDIFIQKIDSSGNLIWVKKVGAANNAAVDDVGHAIKVDKWGNVYITGEFKGLVDFDPSIGIYTLSCTAIKEIFILKLNSNGDFVWAKSTNGSQNNIGKSLEVDTYGNVYISGNFQYVTDFDPGVGVYNLSGGNHDAFIMKLDSLGELIWAEKIGGPDYDLGNSLSLDLSGNIIIGGLFEGIADFDPSASTFNISSSAYLNGFVAKFNQDKIIGTVFHDLNQNCIKDPMEMGMEGVNISLSGNNLITTSTSTGYWGFDSLPIGGYTVNVDTSLQNWIPTCPTVYNFNINNSDSLVVGPNFGFVATNPCSKPDVSISAPFLRPGFSNQKVYVQACNLINSTKTMDSVYVVIELDSLLTVQGGSRAYTSLGSNRFKINLDTIYPGQCLNFYLNCQLNTNAVLGKTLCMNARLFPIDSCYLDTIPNPFPSGISPCNLGYDNSHLIINSSCENDTINFVVKNIGDGDMACYSQVRGYIDGDGFFIDSVQLMVGDSAVFVFNGDGRTWRFEVDQHPLHLGNSRPSNSIEMCGNLDNWTPDLINIFPHDDADPIVDIYCGLVRGSYDPNDKTGFPLGSGDSSYILLDQSIDYLIRFQNTGTDTAINVIIKDTLPNEVDISSVIPQAASHKYSFRIYGPRVLEWTFSNIMLPDSNTNESASHGFLTFNVKQKVNLPLGTVIENDAAIYFDYNTPIFTNTTLHTIQEPQNINLGNTTIIDSVICGSIDFNNIYYTKPGIYYQTKSTLGIDSLYILNLTSNNSSSSVNEVKCHTYTAPDGQVYTASGQYTAVISNYAGCDSVITIDLTIKDSTSSTIAESVCNEYTALDGQAYTASGQYTAVISNYVGCDSVITIDLTIKDSTSSIIIESVCNEYTAPDSQVYTASGQYTAIIPNYAGCDSVITIDLTIKDSTSSTITESLCNEYTAPDGQVYTASGQYTVVISNYLGCDSVITIDLTIKDSTSSTTIENVCEEYTAPNGQVYTISGQHIEIMPNLEGCDSVITINFTIDSLPLDTIILNGTTLSLSTVRTAYQWLDCNNGNTPISGATNSTFTPSVSGNYAVEITNGACVVQSNCVNVTIVGNKNLVNKTVISVYPNPVKSILYIDQQNSNEIDYQLIDNLGRVLLQGKSINEITELDIKSFAPGIYFLFVNDGNQSIIYKVVKN